MKPACKLSHNFHESKRIKQTKNTSNQIVYVPFFFLLSLGKFSHFHIWQSGDILILFCVRGVKFFSEEGNPDKNTSQMVDKFVPVRKTKIPEGGEYLIRSTTKGFLSALKMGSSGGD